MDRDEDEVQARLLKEAFKCFGAFVGGDARRSENVRLEVRRRLRRRNTQGGSRVIEPYSS